MNSDETSKQTWNKIASIYQDKFMELPIYNHCYDIFLQLIKSNKPSLLDIACGPGNVSSYLLKQNPNLSITGIDYSENMIDLASKNNPGAQFKILDSIDILTLNTKYDGIICGFGIPFLDEIELATFVANCSQMLTLGAPLYISFEAGNYENSGYKIGMSGNRIYFRYHRVTTLINLCAINSLKTPQVFKIKYNQNEHTVIITEKQ